MQSVKLEFAKAAVSTARYFCGLGLADFELTGQYYSKIAVAAAFIAYKYAPCVSQSVSSSSDTLPPAVEFPKAMELHSGYSIKEIEPVVMQLLATAKEVETTCEGGITGDARYRVPVDVYLHYKRVAVTATNILPDFAAFFAGLDA